MFERLEEAERRELSSHSGPIGGLPLHEDRTGCKPVDGEVSRPKTPLAHHGEVVMGPHVTLVHLEACCGWHQHGGPNGL